MGIGASLLLHTNYSRRYGAGPATTRRARALRRFLSRVIPAGAARRRAGCAAEGPRLILRGHVPAAVQIDRLARDVVGFRQQDRSPASFARMAEVAERDAVGRGVAVAGDHVGFKQSWSDGVGGDAFF